MVLTLHVRRFHRRLRSVTSSIGFVTRTQADQHYHAKTLLTRPTNAALRRPKANSLSSLGLLKPLHLSSLSHLGLLSWTPLFFHAKLHRSPRRFR